MPPPGRTGTDAPAAPNASALFEDILAQLRRTVVTLADSSREVEAGWVARTPSLPLVHTLNQVHVRAAVSVDDALALVQREQGELPYRHLEVSHAGSGEALVGALRGGGGWRIDREVFMALAEAPAAGPGRRAGVGTGRAGVVTGSAGRAGGGSGAGAVVGRGAGSVTELNEDEMLRLMRRWLVEDHLDTGEGVLDQLDEYNRREGRLWHERIFGVRDDHGTPLAVTKLRAEGDVGWVEDVYTMPEARGRGYARALVTHATDEARAAGYGLVFILADDEDWPKNLYYEIGFRPVGRVWTFHHEEVA